MQLSKQLPTCSCHLKKSALQPFQRGDRPYTSESESDSVYKENKNISNGRRPRAYSNEAERAN